MKKFFTLAFILFFGISSFSQTNTWDGSSGNNWNTAANWSLNLVPTAAHDVVININATITVDATSNTINSLTISGSATVIFLCGAQDATITIDNTGSSIGFGSTLTLQGAMGSGTRSMGLAYSGANQTMSIAGAFNITNTGEGTIYNASNSITTVTGTINNTGGAITSTAANLSFASVGTYIHALDGGTIPTATWNTASNCNITGITGTVPAGLTQAFGNFTWNCAGHTGTINLLGNLTTINGNFIINRAGSPQGPRVTSPLVLTQNTNTTLNVGGDFTLSNLGIAAWFALTNGTAAVTMNVTGNFNMSNATSFFDYNIGASQNSALIVNVTGNYVQTGGFLDWAFTPTTGSVASELRVAGNFSHTGTALLTMTMAETSSTVPNGKITFNNAGSQTFTSTTPANIGYTNYEVAIGSTLELLSNVYLYYSTTSRWGAGFVVKSGAILDANTNQLTCNVAIPANGLNTFTLESGSGIITANTNGVQNGTTGTVYNVIASRTFSSGANYTYDGSAVQNSGIFTTTPTANQVNNLTVNNSAGRFTTGVTLQQPIAIATACTFTQGVITTSATNLLTFNAGSSAVGANNNPNPSFVHGPVLKKGNTDFEFPVGNTATGMIPIAISNLSGTSDFQAEYKRIPASSLGPCTAPGLHHVSRCEYWQLDRTGAAAANVTLHWNNFSNCNFPVAIQNTNLASIYVAHFNGTSWDAYGRNSVTGNPGSGTVTWNDIATFSPFSLGTTDPDNIPLKVKLGDIKAYQLGNNIKVEWSNLTETDVIDYEVERSGNGIEFTSVGQQLPRSNSNDRQDYSLLDYAPLPGANFYRIRILEKNGRISYSKIVKVEMGTSISNEFIIYPNPVRDKQVSVNINGWEKGQYTIRVFNSSGQLLFGRTFNHTGGSMTEIIQLPATIGQGYYSMLIGNEKISRNKSFIVQ